MNDTTNVVGNCTFEGLRGKFNVVVLQAAVEEIPELELQKSADVLSTKSFANSSNPLFTDVEEGTEIFQSVEVVNDGDTVLEYAFTSSRGLASSASIKNKNIEIKTRIGSVGPRSRKSISISVRVKTNNILLNLGY